MRLAHDIRFMPYSRQSTIDRVSPSTIDEAETSHLISIRKQLHQQQQQHYHRVFSMV